MRLHQMRGKKLPENQSSSYHAPQYAPFEFEDDNTRLFQFQTSNTEMAVLTMDTLPRLTYEQATSQQNLEQKFAPLIAFADKQNYSDRYGLPSAALHTEALAAAYAGAEAHDIYAAKFLDLYQFESHCSNTGVVYFLGQKLNGRTFTGALILDNVSFNPKTRELISSPLEKILANSGEMMYKQDRTAVYSVKDTPNVRVVVGDIKFGFFAPLFFASHPLVVAITGSTENSNSLAVSLSNREYPQRGIRAPEQVMAFFSSGMQNTGSIPSISTVATIGYAEINTLPPTYHSSMIGLRICHEPITVLPTSGDNINQGIEQALEYLTTHRNKVTPEQRHKLHHHAHTFLHKEHHEPPPSANQTGETLITSIRLVRDYHERAIDDVISYLTNPEVIPHISKEQSLTLRGYV